MTRLLSKTKLMEGLEELLRFDLDSLEMAVRRGDSAQIDQASSRYKRTKDFIAECIHINSIEKKCYFEIYDAEYTKYMAKFKLLKSEAIA